MSGPRVFEGGAELDAAWLTEVLRASGGLSGDETVDEIRSERIGTGQMGVCDRLHLRIAGSDGQPAARTIVGKFASDAAHVRASMGPTGYTAEIEFYLDIAPTLDGHLATCHYAAIDPMTFSFTLLLDDLAPAAPGDQLVPLSADAATAGIDELVSLHLPYWGDPALSTQRCFSHTALEGATLQQVYEMALPGFLDRFAAVLGPTRAEVYELLGTGTTRWWDERPEVDTIVHGDFRADNLMFGRSGAAVTVAPVDFQGVRRGPGTVDVAFFLGTSLETDDRRALEDSLLRRWHDALCDGGVDDYPWSDCLRDYRWATVGALTTTVIGAAFSEVTARGEEMFAVMTTRQADQILDFDGADLLRPPRSAAG